MYKEFQDSNTRCRDRPPKPMGLDANVRYWRNAVIQVVLLAITECT
jgi:hypothetical protein